MKSFFTTYLALLPFLSLLSIINPANARLTVRHDHSAIARRGAVGVVDTPGLVKKSTPAPPPKTYLAPAPHWIAYTLSDYSNTQAFPTAAELNGFNVFVMSFWYSSGTPAFKAAEFVKLSQSTRNWIINDYHSRGISFLVSAFGYGDNPTSDGKDPVAVANNLAAFVKKYNLDGVDIDWEDFRSLLPDNGKAEKWLSDFTVALRKQLPLGQYILTHAPIAPWFTTNSTRYPFGAYRTVHTNVGSLIDWYNVQFYNQGSDYTNCPSLLTRSLAGNFHNTSVFEINAISGVPLNKLVIGKPASVQDATNGFTNLTVVSQCLQLAKTAGWNAGAFLWQYPTANTTSIGIVRSLSWPISG